MKTTLGGDRLGSGNKQEISMRNYERSTHDLGYIWRSSMSAGTLVPFMSEVALPGDSMDIDLDMAVLTLPTIGPLFGSYKVQADVFMVPMRIYNGKLHMNMLNIGNDMQQAKIPQLNLNHVYYTDDVLSDNLDNSQINPSSILSYLNIRGLGIPTPEVDGQEILRSFNGIPLLGYWDIFKNYYANKQEDKAYVIHTNETGSVVYAYTAHVAYYLEWGSLVADISNSPMTRDISAGDNPTIEIFFDSSEGVPNAEEIMILVGGVATPLYTLFETYEWHADSNMMEFRYWIAPSGSTTYEVETPQGIGSSQQGEVGIFLQDFDLTQIDVMKKQILKDVDSTTAFDILGQDLLPYSLLKTQWQDEDDKWHFSKQYSQEGLAVKTYQSDLFNNWINTEWIDGTNGVNEISAVSTVGDSFTIDALNLAQKVYVMLNRIALSGGTYDDWLNAVYTHERAGSLENPVYMGSLIKELTFDEVISNSATVDEPLGTLAGRGRLTNKHKGGSIKIKVNEPCYIMGIVSLTPRVDYSQGNKWDTNLKTWDDLHKPALDAIGFEDLITDQMSWADTSITSTNEVVYHSAGKQPAWINYMTNVNQVRGSFAIESDSMYMTLNRRYTVGAQGIKDLTTYVDPSKFNHIFADTRLDAQNFWVQIKVDNIARRKMSAKVIPNL